MRTFYRYIVPSFLASLYYSLRYRCLVSTQTRIQLSEKISFGRGTTIAPFVVMQTWRGKIAFGRDCTVGSFSHITTGDADVVVGDYVRMGSNITIMGGGRNFKEKDALIINQGSYHRAVSIENDVLIGAGVIILPGCNIEKGAVIGAASLVNSDVPAYSIVAGVPAKVIGERE